MEDLACVATYRTRVDADMARATLETETIPSMISADDAGGWGPYIMMGTGGVKLLVRQSDLERAREILENGTEEETPDPD